MDYDDNKRRTVIEAVDLIRSEGIDDAHLCIGLVDYLVALLVTNNIPLEGVLEDIEEAYATGKKIMKRGGKPYSASAVREMLRQAGVDTSRH